MAYTIAQVYAAILARFATYGGTTTANSDYLKEQTRIPRGGSSGQLRIAQSGHYHTSNASYRVLSIEITYVKHLGEGPPVDERSTTLGTTIPCTDLLKPSTWIPYLVQLRAFTDDGEPRITSITRVGHIMEYEIAMEVIANTEE